MKMAKMSTSSDPYECDPVFIAVRDGGGLHFLVSGVYDIHSGKVTIVFTENPRQARRMAPIDVKPWRTCISREWGIDPASVLVLTGDDMDVEKMVRELS